MTRQDQGQSVPTDDDVRWRTLFPENVGDYMTVLDLPAPYFPDSPYDPDIRNTLSVREFYLETFLGEIIPSAGDDRIGFVDKSFPHSRFDAMVLASNDEPRTSVNDMDEKTLVSILEIAHHFVRFVSDEERIETFGLDDGHLHMAFNFDRETTDRENSMFYDKRFHLHCNYYPGKDLGWSDSLPFSEVSDRQLKRGLIDPLSFLGPRLLRDYLSGSDLLEHCAPLDPTGDVRNQIPPGLRVELNGWDDLLNGRVATLLRGLHEAAEECYAHLFSAFTGQAPEAEPWWRPRLLDALTIDRNLEALEWLSEESVRLLRVLRQGLTNVSDREMAMFRVDPARAIRHLAHAGLDYSVSIFSRQRNTADARLVDHGDVFLLLNFKLLGDIGGAGIVSLPGLPLMRVNRRSGFPFTPDEITQRSFFNEQFVGAVASTIEELGRGRFVAHGDFRVS